MKKSKNIVWGLSFILLAVIVILSQITKLNIFNGFSLSNVLLIALLTALIIHGIIKMQFSMIFIPLGFIYYICSADDILPESFPEFNIWLTLLITILLSIGCSMIFKGNKKSPIPFDPSGKKASVKVSTGTEAHTSGTAGSINLENRFGGTTRYVDCNDFRELTADNNFGQLDIYLSNVTLASASCKIMLDNSFGTINLYLPKEWQVMLNPDSSFGHVEFHKTTDAPAGAPIAYVNAESSFGSIEIFQL